VRAFPVLTALAALLGSTAIPAARNAAQTAVREGVARNVYVTLTDDSGAPVTDLRPEEVSVRADGKPREILKVGPPSETLHVVLLVDDSGPGIQHIREGVAEFIGVLQGRAEMALISTAGQNMVMADFTPDAGTLLHAVRRLATRTTSGGYLLDGIHESAQALRRRNAERGAIVVLALEGTEFSSISKERVIDAVRQSGAVVHVLSVGKPTLKTMTPWNQRPTQSIHDSLDETMTRSKVFAEAPRLSGGRMEQVLEFTGIPARLTDVARDLRDQIAITYAARSGGDGKLDVSVKRRGVKLRAPRHARP
jgi:VWFA-related protein